MPILTVDTQVEHRVWSTHDATAPKGSGYCLDSGQYYQQVKRWKLFGITIWRKVIDREEIPSFVWIERGCYGRYFGNWRSKFAPPAE